MVSLLARENISAFDEILAGNYIPAAHRKIWPLGLKIGQSMRVLGRCDRSSSCSRVARDHYRIGKAGQPPRDWQLARHLSMPLVKSSPQGQISKFREMYGIVSILGKFSSI